MIIYKKYDNIGNCERSDSLLKLVLKGALVAVLAFSVTATAFATDGSDQRVPISGPKLEDVADVIELEDGSLEIIPFDPESYIQQTGLEKPSPDAQLVSIKRVNIEGEEINLDESKRNNNSIMALGLSVKKTSVGTGTSPNRIARGRMLCSITSGCSNLKVEINTTESVSAEFSANYSISAEVVSAGVGYTIGTSRSISISGSEHRAVPYGKFLVLDAYPRIEITGFEIWDQGLFTNKMVGSGSSWRAVSNEMDFVVWIQ